jgi:hypothetical protein
MVRTGRPKLPPHLKKVQQSRARFPAVKPKYAKIGGFYFLHANIRYNLETNRLDLKDVLEEAASENVANRIMTAQRTLIKESDEFTKLRWEGGGQKARQGASPRGVVLLLEKELERRGDIEKEQSDGNLSNWGRLEMMMKMIKFELEERLGEGEPLILPIH